MNFKFTEFTKSNTASAKGIDNVPKDLTVFDNLMALIVNVLQPLREAYGKPIIIGSGYRCKALNKAVGGVENSQHMKGEAADLQTGSTKGNKELMQLAKRLKLPFDQMINEKPDKDGNPSWVHISYRPNPRRQVITIR